MNKLILIAILFISASSFSQSETADQIIEKAENRLNGTTSYSEITITTVRPKWSREMKIKTWAKGDDYSVTLVLIPAKDKGTVFLKRKMKNVAVHPFHRTNH